MPAAAGFPLRAAPDGASEVSDGVGGGRARPRGQGRRLRPGTALDGESRGNGRERGVHGEDARCRREIGGRRLGLREGGGLVDQPPGGVVLRALQMRVHEEIHRVHVGLGGGDRGAVRLDGFLPHPQHREDVRRHVERVGRGRRDGVVAPRGTQAPRGERGEVVAVDQVVERAGVLGMLCQDALEEARGLQVARVALVGGEHRDGLVQRRR